jgi:hypothetical protein
MAGSAGKRCKTQGEHIDRSRNSSSRDSTSSLSSRSPNWKKTQTSKVSKAPAVATRRQKHKATYSSSDEDGGENDGETDQEKAAHKQDGEGSDDSPSDSEEENDDNQRVVKQNRSNKTYSYKLSTGN